MSWFNRKFGKMAGFLTCLLLACPAYADMSAGDYTWSGQGMDTNVTTTANWTLDQAPLGSYDNLFFDGGKDVELNQVTFDRNGDIYNNITFNADAGIFSLEGAVGVRINLADGGSITTLSYNQTVADGEIEQAFTVGMNLLGDLTINTTNNCITMQSALSCDADSVVTKTGEHGVQLFGNNENFLGTFIVNDGWMAFEPVGEIGAPFGGSIILNNTPCSTAWGTWAAI